MFADDAGGADAAARDLAAVVLQLSAERDDRCDDGIGAFAGRGCDLFARRDGAVGGDEAGEDLSAADIDGENQLRHFSAPVAMPPMK